MKITNCPMCQSPLPAEPAGAPKTCAGCGADLSRWTRERTAPPPLPVQAEAPASSFPNQAALVSVVAPLFSIGVSLLGHQAVRGNRVGMLVLGGVCSLFILAGFLLGMVAL